MNSKQRRQARRRLENSVADVILNDFCVFIYECREPMCPKKFGRYHDCKRYLENNPRTDTREPLLYNANI